MNHHEITIFLWVFLWFSYGFPMAGEPHFLSESSHPPLHRGGKPFSCARSNGTRRNGCDAKRCPVRWLPVLGQVFIRFIHHQNMGIVITHTNKTMGISHDGSMVLVYMLTLGVILMVNVFIHQQNMGNSCRMGPPSDVCWLLYKPHELAI